MLVAVPLFGKEVAPRFGFAERYLVAEIVDERVVRWDLVATEFRGWVSRLCELRDLGVEVVLCGGFNRSFFPLAEDMGIRVLAGLTGDAREVVEVFIQGDALPFFPGKGARCCDAGDVGAAASGLGRAQGKRGCRGHAAENKGRRGRRNGRERRADRGGGGDPRPM